MRVVRDLEPAAIDAVLCCAEGGVPAILAAFPALVAQRMCPRAVAGIDEDDAPLIDAIDRAKAPTLFVLCVGPRIGGARTHRLVEAFSQHRGPLHRLLVVEPNASDPEGFVESLRRGAEGLRRQLAPARAILESMVHSGSSPATKGVAESKGPVLTPLPRKGEVVVADPLRDEVGRIPEHVGPPPGLQRSTPRLRLVAPPEPPAEDACDPNADTAELPQVDIVAPGNRRWIAVAAAAGAVVGISLAVLPGAEPTATTSMMAGLSDLDVTHAVVEGPTVDGSDAVEPERTPSQPAAVEPEPAAMAWEPTLSPPAAVERRPGSVGRAGAARIELEGDEARLREAVAVGRIRRLDLLFIAPPSDRAMKWGAANGRCRRLSVDGVGGWRLPTAGELKALWRHQMSATDTAWSITKATKASTPSNYVWSSAQRRLVVLPKDGRAQALCVRRRD